MRVWRVAHWECVRSDALRCGTCPVVPGLSWRCCSFQKVDIVTEKNYLYLMTHLMRGDKGIFKAVSAFSWMSSQIKVPLFAKCMLVSSMEVVINFPFN